jgi:uncharacterized protein YbjT (DUF2867 family)
MRILVLGGTGVVGRHVVKALADRGHEVAALSRGGSSPDPRATGYQGDLATGAGLAAALDGVSTVIDCGNVAALRREAAVRFFRTATERVQKLGAAAGVSHLVVLSIVGIDRVPTGYYAGKLAQEKAALDGPLPASIVRATQFHEFAGQALGFGGIGPIRLVPAMRSQPIAGSEVAMVLADIAEKPAVGRAPDIGGPAEESMPALSRALVRHLGQHKLVVPLRVPGAAGRAIRDGGLLLDAGGVARGPTFADWLSTLPSVSR